MFCITTLMKVPPPTGPKSHASGPELLLMLLLMVLLGGVAVCAEATGIKCGADTRTRIKSAIANSKHPSNWRRMSVPPPKLLFCFLGRLSERALFLPLRLTRSPTRNCDR